MWIAIDGGFFGVGGVVGFVVEGTGVGGAFFLFAPEFFEGAAGHLGQVDHGLDLAAFGGDLGVEIAESGDPNGEGAVEPGVVGGAVDLFVAVEVAGGFFVAFAGGVILGPGGALERALVDEDEGARASVTRGRAW